MIEIRRANQSFYWSTLFLRALWQNGLAHVVISPGSRSTPLTMAAAAFPQLKKHVILDERAAAFMALGIGKANNQPAVLICTSGTAVANYFPAVIEARKSSTPLLLLTADRPQYLHHTGANQTIKQQNIFGDYPVFFHDTGEPVMNKNDIANLTRLARQAQYYAITKQGPVHINFPFRKPLEPDRDFVEKTGRENEHVSSKPPTLVQNNLAKNFRFNDDILYELNGAKQPLIIIGQLAATTNLGGVFELAEQLNAPVLSEQGIHINGNNYAIHGFEGFLRNEDIRDTLEPDFILRFGLQPAGKSLLQAIEYWNPDRHVYFSDSGNWSDIENSTTDVIDWNGARFVPHIFTDKSSGWLKKWKQTNARYSKKLDSILAKENVLTDGHIYHHLVPEIPEQWSVSISNSFPARDQSMFGKWGTQKIFMNRGVSGIDGITSTAMGVNIGLDQPGILFTGDLAFLHDTNAMLNHEKLPQPLVIVVINNRGGSIFRMLPIANHRAYFDSYFETPQIANIPELAKSYGISVTKIETIGQLQQLNFQDLIYESESMVSVVECKTDPDASMKIRNILWEEDRED